MFIEYHPSKCDGSHNNSIDVVLFSRYLLSLYIFVLKKSNFNRLNEIKPS